MKKRYIDCDLWEEDWFIELPMQYKMFWIYILNRCDHAGIWKPNTTMFQRLNQIEINLDEFLKLINADKERIIVLANGRWYIDGFIKFQYGKCLNDKNRVHKSVIDRLIENGVNLNSIRPQIELKMNYKDKEKDKEKDIDKDIDKEIEEIEDVVIENLEEDYSNTEKNKKINIKNKQESEFYKQAVELKNQFQILLKENIPKIYNRLSNGYEQKWVECFELMLRVDKRPLAEIQALNQYVLDKKINSWWASTENFQSPLKYRQLKSNSQSKYYDIILLQMQRDKNIAKTKKQIDDYKCGETCSGFRKHVESFSKNHKAETNWPYNDSSEDYAQAEAIHKKYSCQELIELQALFWQKFKADPDEWSSKRPTFCVFVKAIPNLISDQRHNRIGDGGDGVKKKKAWQV